MTIRLSERAEEMLEEVASCHELSPEEAVHMLIRREHRMVDEVARDITLKRLEQYERQVIPMGKSKGKGGKGKKGC